MKFLEGLMHGYFKSDADGNRVFFPWGSFGKGRLIENQELEQQLLRFIPLFSILIGVLMAIVAIFVSPIWLAPLIPVAAIFYDSQLKKILGEAPVSEEKISFKDALENMALKNSKNSLRLWLTGSILFVCLNLFVITQIGPDLFSGVIAIFFAANAIFFLYLLRLKGTLEKL